MLKILICCGGGFSSSYVTERMKKEIVEKNLENEVNIEFYPFAIVEDKLSDVDIIMCCPHLKIYVEMGLPLTTVFPEKTKDIIIDDLSGKLSNYQINQCRNDFMTRPQLSVNPGWLGPF